MDIAYISALSALAGSVVGGLTSGVTTWLGLRAQARAGQRAHDHPRQGRVGKTFATLMDLLLKALRTPHGRFAYVAPYYNQAKTVLGI